MKAKIIVGALLTAIFLLIVMGCSDSETTFKNRSSEPVVLNLFSSSGADQAWFDRTYGEYLTKKFPHITFTVHFPSSISLADYVASNEPLDIIFGAYMGFFSAIKPLNLHSDISDLIKKYKVNMEKFEPTINELQKQMTGGYYIGLPAFIGTSGLYYNKDIFDKFAIDYPREGMTWDELYDLAVRLTRTDGDVQYYGFANDNYNYIQANQLSLDLVDTKTMTANFETDPWKKVVQTLTRFMQIPGYNTAEATVAAFNTKGTVAMATNYTGCCGFTPGQAVSNWDVVRIPVFPEARNAGVQVGANIWFMSSISKQREVAFEVIQFISSEEFQISLNSRGLATALKDTKLHERYGDELPFYDGKNVTALFPHPRAKMSNITEFQLIAASQLNAAMTRMANEGIDINTALREAAEVTNQMIKEAQEKK